MLIEQVLAQKGGQPISVGAGMPVVATWDRRTAEDGSEVLLPQWRSP